MLTESISISCPYCGESFASTADCSAGDQEYVEDCTVCCCPILVNIRLDEHCNVAGLEVRRENE